MLLVIHRSALLVGGTVHMDGQVRQTGHGALKVDQMADGAVVRRTPCDHLSRQREGTVEKGA